MDYILKHWRGNFSLRRSFWLNFITGLLLICLFEYFLHHFVNFNNRVFSILAILFFIVFHLIVFLWQSLGVLRACDLNIRNYISSGWTRAAQFVVITCFTATLIWGVTLWQNLWLLKIDEQNKQIQSDSPANSPVDYTLSMTAPDTLHIEGVLSPGITRETTKLLSKESQIKVIQLNSAGGNIFEARGLAKLIKDNKLSTHITARCFSSCTTVFIAGQPRTLAENGTLGFHQYKINSKKLFAPNVNVEKEQNKDFDYFLKQGVSEAFLEKAFAIPFEKMWYPTQDELREAGVLLNDSH